MGRQGRTNAGRDNRFTDNWQQQALEGSGAKHLYKKVDAFIRNKLATNVWKPGSMLPSEMELVKILDVSQGTVRKAIDTLVNEKLITRRQGVGTFVSEMTERRELFLFFNLVDDDGYREIPTATIISTTRGVATVEEARNLNLGRTARVTRFVRVRILLDRPKILETIVVPNTVFPKIGVAPLPHHLFRYYELAYGVTVSRVSERIRAVSALQRDAKLLGLAKGAPLLQIDRRAFTLNNRCIEWRVSRCETSQHSYLCERQ